MMEIGKTFRLEDQFSPVVLAGILDVSTQAVYGLIKQGRIVPEGNYREVIQSYIAYWKKRADKNHGSIAEIALARKAELDRARVEEIWLRVKSERSTLISLQEFSDVFSPLFLQVKDQLIAIGKKHSDIREELLRLLDSWADLGEKYIINAEEGGNSFMDRQLSEMERLEDQCIQEVNSLGKSSEELEEKFNGTD